MSARYEETYNWKRFWCPREGTLGLYDHGYLADPDGPYGRLLGSDLHTFEQIADLPCLALLGEPGIGKTTTMQAERVSIDANIRAAGGRTLWLNLAAYSSEETLVRKLFNSSEFRAWEAGDYRLHLFLDGLDECRLRIENVAALLAEELQEYPVERLSLRIGCRTADWPKSLEEDFGELWGEESFGVYELAPLRRADVVAAAERHSVDSETFLRAVDEAEAVPLAIKPVTLEFLLEIYSGGGEFPSKQAELYRDGCRRLCEERNQRRVESGGSGEFSSDQRLAVCARIAATTVFSNRYAVWSGLERADLEGDDLLVREVAGGTETAGGSEFHVDENVVREALATGLFSARGPERLSWAHQTYAEFLAAHYLTRKGVGTEQVMSLFTHPDDQEGRLVPQLHEAAAWLASMRPEVFRAVSDADPEALLASDVASTDEEDRAALVDILLRLYDEERLLDVGLVPRGRYKKLQHPGLADQLKPYVSDPRKGLVVRRVAIDMAEACQLQALQCDAAEVALDPDQDQLVRKEAAHFVAVVGDGPTRARLLSLARGEAGEDEEDDLKGNALRAVWPEYLSAEELFATLTLPKKANYHGAYESFMAHELTKHLSTQDVPAALAWVEQRPAGYEEPMRFEELADAIMQRAYAQLNYPGVAPAFAKAALARLRNHDEVIKERREIFEAINEPTFSERLANDDGARRLLLEEMIDLLEPGEGETYFLVHSKSRLVTAKDVEWLIVMFKGEPSDRRKDILAELIRGAFNLWNDELYELVYREHLKEPVLAKEVGRLFAPVELDSKEAETQRKIHESSRRRMREDEEHPLLDPPLVDRVVGALDDFEAGNTGAFWHGVYYLMQFEASGQASTNEVEWDMIALPGWQSADSTTRERIVEAAKRYLLEGDPQTDEWLGKDITYRPALAGYRALRLLINLAPDFVAELPADVWERWTPIILDYPITTGTGDDEEEQHLQLVASAYRNAPDMFLETLLFLIETENEKREHLFVLSSLRRCWDDRLARTLLEKAKDSRLKWPCLGALLEALLDYRFDKARLFAESLLVSCPEDDEAERARAVAAAHALVFHSDDASWHVVWPAIQGEDGLGDELVNAIVSGAHHSELPHTHLTDAETADLYILLARRYPESEYYLDFSDGAIIYGRKEHIADWRDGVLRHLQSRGTFEACRQIERVAAKLPELRGRLKWVLYQARAEARRHTWSPPEPEHVLALAKRPESRLVQNGDQLIEVLLDSLGRLEGKLQGETPMAPALWDFYKPKNEEWFSDYVKQHLQEDLRGRGVVLNREVVIRKGEADGSGERTDIHVDAIVPGSTPETYETASVIVEAKGCWNPELNTAMEKQLIGRYLEDNPQCSHGLYLVGWYTCDQWDDQDYRKKRSPNLSIDEARERFKEQTTVLSTERVRVDATVLDTSLR